MPRRPATARALLSGALITAVAAGLLAAAPAADAAPEPLRGNADAGSPAPASPAGFPRATDRHQRLAPATRLIVKYRDASSSGARLRSLSARGLSAGQLLPLTGAELVDVPSGQTARSAAAALAQDPSVEYAVPDVRRQGYAQDPYLPYQWGLQNLGNPLPASAQEAWLPVAGVDVDAPGAWAVSRGRRAVTVAVVDSGVQSTHEDLKAAIWVNPREKAGNKKDDDGNGLVDDVNGYDFYNDKGAVFTAADGDQHGTHVAGVVGAGADNGVGGAGLASGVGIMALKFLGPDGGTDSDAIRAIGYARAKGAKVINASWGASVVDEPDAASPALRDAIANCGCVFVSAAGNGGADEVGDDIDNPAQQVYPASFRLPNQLTVAAVDDRGLLAPFSNFGAATVDLAAPGSSVLSSFPGNQYAWDDGTSMATPFVTAAAALVLSVVPSMAPADVVSLLKANTKPLAGLSGKLVTGGMLSAGQTMRALAAAQTVTRLAGADRYATAAAVAEKFEPGVTTAYVASGLGYADALAGAALAGGQRAPVLLTSPQVVPAATSAALRRLAPGRIIVLGGAGSVSAATLSQLKGLTAGTVTRLDGADRYATAAAVSGQFAPQAPVVYLASGLGYADALAGAALAAREKAPVLLTGSGVLPVSTRDALLRLQPKRVVVLGGTASVSGAVASTVGTLTGAPVSRLAGADRYATAAAVAQAFEPGLGAAYVASGLGYADALSGAALAGGQGQPVLLTSNAALSAATATALTRLAPKSIVALGGIGSLPSWLTAELKRYQVATP